MPHRLLVGFTTVLRNRRSCAFALLLSFLLTSVLFYRITNGYVEEFTRSREREVSSLRRHVLVLEGRIVGDAESIREQITAIADVARGNLSEIAQKKLKMIERSLSMVTAPRFFHRLETSNLDCARLFAGDRSYLEEVSRSRIAMIENSKLDMSCEAIRQRVFSQPRRPAINYGIAFARIVHTDYEFLEEQLQVSYSSENHFCYHVDSKSSADFKERMERLSTCLPNVYLTDVRLDINSQIGTNMNFAHMACLKLLDEKGSWHYVILQQTHDVVIRTNSELKQIFEVLNGSNDVQITPCAPFLYNQSMSWNAESLGVFNGSHSCAEMFAKFGASVEVVPISHRLPPEAVNFANSSAPLWNHKEYRTPFELPASALTAPLFIAKGAVQVSLSRAAVTWMNRVNLTELINQFNSGKQSADEMLMSTVQIAEQWRMPGGFTERCIRHGYSYDGITRMVHWRADESQCKSKYLRHLVCVLGVEDLPSISKYHHILVNKMMPSFDYGAIACVSELLFNRTHLGQDDHPLDLRYFENLPVVRFNKATNQEDLHQLCQNPYEYKWDEI